MRSDVQVGVQMIFFYQFQLSKFTDYCSLMRNKKKTGRNSYVTFHTQWGVLRITLYVPGCQSGTKIVLLSVRKYHE